MAEYGRNDRSDLSGMTKQAALDYLQPHYKTDEDLSVENLKLALGPWLLIAAVVGGIGAVAWGLFALL